MAHRTAPIRPAEILQVTQLSQRDRTAGCPGLEAIYTVHLGLIGKLLVDLDLLLVIIELFSLDAFVLSQYTRLTDGRTDRSLTDIIYHACIAAKR